MSVKGRIAVLVVTLSAVLTVWVAAATPAMAACTEECNEVVKPGEPAHLRGEYKGWVVEGSVTTNKGLLSQTVTLPEGSKIDLKDEIEIEEDFRAKFIEGTVTGFVTVPPFKTTLTLPLLGIPTPVETGVTFTQVGPTVLKIHEAPEAQCAGQQYPAGCVTLSGPSNVNIGFDVVGILGIVEIPTHCETSQPIVFNLKQKISLVEMILTGPRFSGTATIPSITCKGLESLVLGTAFTTALSGPDNPFTLSIHNPVHLEL
jgi:hypothetical protein